MFFVRFFLTVVLCWVAIIPGALAADRVIAVVNGQEIMESELDEFTAKVPGPYKEAFKKKSLQQVIEARVFYGMAKDEGLMASEEYKRKMARASQAFLTELFIEKKLKSTINISDRDLDAYYKNNKARFNAAPKVMPGHILVKDKKTADELRKRITPDNFDRIAAGLSKDSPDARYFKLGWMEKGRTRMPPAFEKAAFALKKGEISPVVRSKIGFHIIKAIDAKPGRAKTFEQVKETIRARLTQEKLAGLKQRYLDSANVKIVAKEYQ